MQIFKNIRIDNYRGIRHLEINDFSDVNVFLGKNNIGKSTVLESLFMLTGMSNPEIPQKVNSIRNHLIASPIDDVRYIFHNMDIDIHPIFEADLDGGNKRKLEISVRKYDYLADYSQNGLSSDLSKSFNGIEVKFNHINGKNESFTNTRYITRNGSIQNQINNEYVEVLSALYLPANLYDQNINIDISNIIKSNRKDVLLSMLKEFDSQITTVESLPEGVFVGYDGIDGLMPISMLGDGLRRYLCIVAAIANQNNKILFLDEIDNGIHYTSYEELWKNVFVLAHKFQKQIFVTTHSREVLFALNNVLKHRPEYQSLAGLYTIEKTISGENKSYRYGYKGLSQAFENNIEIRSLI